MHEDRQAVRSASSSTIFTLPRFLLVPKAELARITTIPVLLSSAAIARTRLPG